jgi:hypothetical protein
MLSPAPPKGAVAVAADAEPAGITGSGRAGSVSVEAWLLIGLTILAAVLRFATLSTQSYWFDEAQAAHEVSLSFGALVNTIGAQETSPPLYFALAWVWAKVFGTGEAGLRSLSALLGVAVVPITYLCARELVSRRAGLVAAALAAISPFMIWYSQEAREYMLLAVMSGLSLLFFARSLRDPSRRNLGLWALCSALALLTHFFAGFLVAPEALWLLVRRRSRACVMAVGAVAVVEAALIPLAVSDTNHPLGWLTAFPLQSRIQQVPVTFALGTLYRSSAVNVSLLGAAILTGALIFLLVVGADRAQLRGAGIAAALAAFVLLVPLLFALIGHDFYIARALIPAWIPLAVVIGAACTAPRARVAGAALAVVMLGAFVWAQVKISDHGLYQRPDWRGVAAALGPSGSGPRAIVIYNDSLAIDPLKYYVHGVPWTEPGDAPVNVGEVDVVASSFDSTARRLPAGTRLIGRRDVAGYLVARFALAHPWVAPPAAIGARAGALLSAASPLPAVLIQR